MSDESRRFECHMPGGPEVVDIINVLVYDGTIFIVLQAASRPERPYVLQVLVGGTRFAAKDTADMVVSAHQSEVEQMRVLEEAGSDGG